MTSSDELELLMEKLRWLRLPAMAEHIAALLSRAATENLTLAEVLNRLCDEEKKSRLGRAVERRITGAKFPEINTIDGFDFSFDAVRKKLRARYLALHDVAFLPNLKIIQVFFYGIARATYEIIVPCRLLWAGGSYGRKC